MWVLGRILVRRSGSLRRVFGMIGRGLCGMLGFWINLCVAILDVVLMRKVAPSQRLSRSILFL